MNKELKKQILDLHKGGKLNITSKHPIDNRNILSMAYTPGVAEVCREIEKDKNLVYKYTIKNNTVAIVTDGSAVLGLGNIGAEASLPVMEGKAQLFKDFANVQAFPIALVTQDTEEIINIVKNIYPVFGAILLEDISAPRCFEIESRLIEELDIPVFHDDQHGTAIIVLAGLINASKVKGVDLKSLKIVISGAGAAGLAITKLLLLAGVEDIVILDSKGALWEGRDRDMNSYKKDIVKKTNPNKLQGSLGDVIKNRDVFIGVSKPDILTEEMINSMVEDPVIFALANPNPEVNPEIAKAIGVRLLATGRSDFSNQINNVLVFPGLFRGILDYGIKKITNDIKIAVAEAVASCVSKPTAEFFIPDVFDKKVVEKITETIKKFKNS